MGERINKIIQRFMFPTRKYLNRKFRENVEELDEIQRKELEKLRKEVGHCKVEIVKCREQNRQILKKLTYLENVTKKTMPQTMLNIEVHLVEHCNLNCKSCIHFSPLAQEEFLTVECFADDMRRLADLMDGRMGSIRMMGGEPLLHPKICDFFKIARTCFPDSRISVLTNGLLLNQMEEAFWESCQREDIAIEITKYPIEFPYDEIEKLIERKGSICVYFGGSGIRAKTFNHEPLDLEGRQEITTNFYSCSQANRCIQLRKGRLYTCPIVPYVHHFNKYFKQNLIVSDDDSIDIYRARDKEEIFKFLAHPIPFCRYCDIKGRTHGHEWGRSSLQISEWTKGE